MTRAMVRAEVRVAAPADLVWDYVTDWPRQGEWMPLTHVELLPAWAGDRSRRVGGRFRAWTGVGPVGFWDPITLSTWEEGPDGSRRCEIIHTGRVVRGDAEISVLPVGPDACIVRLWERLEVPGGPLGALLWRIVSPVARPAADRGAALVLERMARRVEALTGRGARG